MKTTEVVDAGLPPTTFGSEGPAATAATAGGSGGEEGRRGEWPLAARMGALVSPRQSDARGYFP